MDKRTLQSTFQIIVIFFIAIIIHEGTITAQNTYYVDQQSGDNINDGTTITGAFQTIEKATSVVEPGDTIEIMGLYTNASFNPDFSYANNHDPHLWHAENTIKINNLNGAPNAYITIKAHDGNTILKGDGANIFRVTNTSFLRIEGFEIEGQVPTIPIETANALQFVYIDFDNTENPKDPTPYEIRYRDQDCVENCAPDAVVDGEIYSDLGDIRVSRPSYIDTRGLYLSKVHHIEILNNTIHNMPGGGLRVSDCEDITIMQNEIYATSRKSYSGTHALVVTKATSTRTTDDYRIKIVGNKIHHNYNEQYSWAPTKTIITPHIDEGKGISLQRNETTYANDGSIKVNWEHGRILVANNIAYFNGFSGVHSNDGNRIDFMQNTCYFNSYTKSITENISTTNGGNIGISAQGGSDIKIINNIAVIDADLNKSAISSNLSAADGLVVKNNIIYGTTQAGITAAISEDADIVAVQENTQMVDPLFRDLLNFDFSLQQSSPAIDMADSENAQPLDYFGNMRGAAPDIGALEYFAALNTKNKDAKAIHVYPNPAYDKVTVEGKPITRKDIQIFDLTGQAFDVFSMDGTNTIDVSRLPSGFYILKVKSIYKKICKY